jgi:hypothetical protein
MLMAALDAEVAEYVAAHRAERHDSGCAMVVRNGRARARTIVTGSGTVEVAAPRVNGCTERARGAVSRAGALRPAEGVAGIDEVPEAG